MNWRGPVEQSEDFARAMNGWTEYLDDLTYRAAGKEILSEMDKIEPGKPVDDAVFRKVALKYNLTNEKKNKLAMSLYESGAIQQKMAELQRKARDEQLLAEASAQTGLPSESAANVKEQEYLSKVNPKPVDLETYMRPDGTAVQVPKGTPAPEGTVPIKVWETKEQIKSRERMRGGAGGGGTGGGNTSVGNGESLLNSDAIQLASAEFLKTGKMPALGMRNGSNRTLIINGAAAMAKERGIDPYKVPALRTEFSALGKSLNNQQKIYNMMGGFVRNLDKQVDRVSSIHEDLVNRIGTRALDVPIRQLKMRFKGSGNEAILEAYMAEISNEIGKLSTGSAASIAELSVGAQERWSKIHDPNLSMNELLKILRETKDMGAMRIDSSREEISSTKGAMDSIWAGNKQTAPSRAVSYLKSAKNRNDAIQRIRALRDKGWSKADLDAAAKEAGWE